MKFELDRLSEYNDEALLSELRRVAALVAGKTLSVGEFSKHSKVGTSTLRRRFGSWKSALEAAGLAHMYNPPPRRTRCAVSSRSMSNDQILAEIRRVAQQTGKTTLTADDLTEHAVVGLGAIRNRFGTLKAAFRAAGCSESPLGRRYTDEECFENLLTVWTHYGRPPKYQEMNRFPSVVGPKAYIIRWKKWNRALQAFVDRANQEAEESPSEQAILIEADVSDAAKTGVPEEDQHKIKLGLRYKVLLRDHFKCVYCGSSPATNPDCRLHVDHIIPWSKGGKTVYQNLQTLCESCNLGKGNHCAAGNAG